MKNGSSIILACGCPHAFQDARYGKAQRVHNIGGKPSSPLARCTVCGAERPVKAGS